MMREFRLNKDYSIICKSEGTHYGFRHIAVLFYNRNEIDRYKICYYNRTWERYTFESIIKELIRKHFENKIKSIKRSEKNKNKEYYPRDYKRELDKAEREYREITEIINKIGG